MGFIDRAKAIWYYNAITKTIKISRNVTFNENNPIKELKNQEKEETITHPLSLWSEREQNQKNQNSSSPNSQKA